MRDLAKLINFVPFQGVRTEFILLLDVDMMLQVNLSEKLEGFLKQPKYLESPCYTDPTQKCLWVLPSYETMRGTTFHNLLISHTDRRKSATYILDEVQIPETKRDLIIQKWKHNEVRIYHVENNHYASLPNNHFKWEITQVRFSNQE